MKESNVNKFLGMTINEEGNGKNLDKLANNLKLITESNEEVFQMIKNFSVNYIKGMFELYSPAELKIKSQKWIEWKKSEILKAQQVYHVIYNDMFDRTGTFDNNDIVNFQCEFNDMVVAQKQILNNIKVRVLKEA